MDMTEGDHARRAHYARSIRTEGQDSLSKVANLIAPGSRVLDVGTGRGALGAYLSAQKGCTLDGIEIDPAQAAVARPSYRTFLLIDLESA
jgi:cyclopropane fatty-acyl-phospholipid synthase-like methyltransferase